MPKVRFLLPVWKKPISANVTPTIKRNNAHVDLSNDGSVKPSNYLNQKSTLMPTLLQSRLPLATRTSSQRLTTCLVNYWADTRGGRCVAAVKKRGMTDLPASSLLKRRERSSTIDSWAQRERNGNVQSKCSGAVRYCDVTVCFTIYTLEGHRWSYQLFVSFIRM